MHTFTSTHSALVDKGLRAVRVHQSHRPALYTPLTHYQSAVCPSWARGWCQSPGNMEHLETWNTWQHGTRNTWLTSISGQSRRRYPRSLHFQHYGPGICAAPRGSEAVLGSSKVLASGRVTNRLVGLHTGNLGWAPGSQVVLCQCDRCVQVRRPVAPERSSCAGWAAWGSDIQRGFWHHCEERTQTTQSFCAQAGFI